MTGAAVRRRKVFYVPGYDPFPPRRYRELYRSEGAAQAAISAYTLTVEAGRGGGLAGYGWHVHAGMDDARVEATVEVLVWSDIVERSMNQGIIATYLQLVRTVWAYMGSGALLRLMRLRKGPMIAALYPIAVLTAELLVALVVGAGICATAGLVLPDSVGLAGGAARLVAALGAVWLVLAWFRRIDNRIFAWYLMHDYAFTAQERGAYLPELEARMAEFADQIAASFAEDWDEVLVVGHSSGVHLAISVLADLTRAGRVPQGRTALGFLSLGQVVPMVSFLPGADRLRTDLTWLSRQDDLIWVDVTAPGDGCAFALCDPVSVSGMAGPGKRWPLVLSAAFTQTLSPARWRALRWRFFRLHFQYLCAFDRPGDYDYFRITAGPLTLADRYRDRAPSKSRIEAPRNPFGRVQ